MEMDDNFNTYFECDNPRKTVEWMREKGLLQTELNCCNRVRNLQNCSYMTYIDQYRLVCSYCNSCINVRTGSIFQKTKGNLYTYLHLIYTWSKENDFIVIDEKVSSSAVSTFYFKLRQVCIEYFNHNPVTMGTSDRNAIVVRQVFQVGNNLILELIDVGASPVVCFLEKVESREQTKIDRITEKVVPLEFIISPEDTVSHEKVVLEYRRKYTALITSDTDEDIVNSFLKQVMWMDRFSDRPFYYLCEHIKAYGNLIN